MRRNVPSLLQTFLGLGCVWGNSVEKINNIHETKIPEQERLARAMRQNVSNLFMQFPANACFLGTLINRIQEELNLNQKHIHIN